MRKIWLVGILVAVLVIGTVGMTMAANDTCLTCSATDANKESNEELKLPEELTKEDLQKLYRKYNVTENDIKFAKGELPHYLDGTILDGKVVTMGKVTKDGKVENWIDPLFYKWCMKNGYKVIPAKKAIEIEKKAIRNYIRKYGVDPANPKIDIVNGIPLPRKYVEELIKGRKLKPEGAVISSVSDRCNDPWPDEFGPYEIYGNLYLYIFEAKDPAHKPAQPYLQDTLNAWGRFYQFDYVDTLYYMHITDNWDASNVAFDIYDIIDDLKDDAGWTRGKYNDKNPDNDLVIGWVHMASRNGVADCDGFFSVAATTADTPDWPHDSIVQHEISHNFKAGEGGTWPWEHENCIMNYWYARSGTDIWCDTHWNVVNQNIVGEK